MLVTPGTEAYKTSPVESITAAEIVKSPFTTEAAIDVDTKAGVPQQYIARV